MSRGLWYATSARTRRGLTLLWLALFLCSIGMQYAQMAAPTPVLAAHNEGIFELDGNALDSPAAGADWQNGAEGSADQFFVGAGSEASANDTTYFTTGGSKDENPISSWKRTSTGGSPDKNELLDAYAAVYDQGGDTWVYFGADRYDNDGDAQIGFWFFQNKVGLSGSSFTGNHKDGDVLILADYTNGGVVNLICAYEWGAPGGNDISGNDGCDRNGSNLNLVAAGVACDVADGTFSICAVTNADSSNAPWTFTNKDGQHDFAPGQFFEGGINLSDMFGGQPPCFGTFLAETRSSQETDAQLKDFALGSLNTCVPPDISTQVKQDGNDVTRINKGESVVDVATFDGSNGPVTGSVDFFVCGPDSNSKPDCSSGGTKVGATKTIANETATSDAFTPGSLGWYCFRAEYTPDDASQYLDGSHTNDTTECFKVIPADVQIVKTPNDGSANAGESISFSLSWTNEGEGKATGVIVSDDLPGGNGLDWSISGSTGTGSTCAISGAVGSEKLTCNIGAIAGNPNYPDPAPVNGTVTVTSATTAASCGAIDNTGQITSDNDGTDTDPGKITVLCPDVNVVKTPNDGQVNAGDPASFSMVVSNDGAGTAKSVSLSDPLPAGLTWALGSVTGDTSGVTCGVTGNPGSQTLSCTDDSMAAGDSFTVTVTTTTSAAQCASYPNLATVDATNESNDPSVTDDNTDPGAITVNCPDVQALKTADASPLNAGDPIGFHVTIKNNGTGTAYGATGSDTLPAGIAWAIDGPANGWSITNGVLSFGPADLAAGASATVHIVGTTDAADCGPISNTVTVDATNESNDPSVTDDNSATANVTVNCPDVKVVKTALDGTISAGEVAAFSIVISNIGAGTAYHVSLSDSLPAGVPWNVDAVAFDGVPVADPDLLCQISGTSLTCADLGDLAPGHEISISVTGDTTLDDCGVLHNVVTVDATNESNDKAITANDSASADVTVDCPLIAIDKDSDHVDPVVIGDQIGFTVTIKNNGQGTAFGVTVSDPLDSRFAWSIATPVTGWSLAGGVLSFSGDLASGATSTVHVVAPTVVGDAAECGLVPNMATLDHPSLDTPSTASASETVRCPDVDLTKSADDDFVEPNQVVTYTINVGVDDGPVTNAVVTDELPLGQTYVTGSGSPAPFSVSVDGRTLTWKFASLSTGDPSTTITYDVTIDAGATGAPQQNTAEVCVAEPTPCASDVALVTPQLPGISLVKTAGNAADGSVLETEAGQVTYHYVVKNTGPLPLFDVTVTDDNGTPGNSADDFKLTCPRTTLAVSGPDQQMECTATVQVTADRTNIAVAHGVTAGGNQVEDQDDAKVVILEFGLTIDKVSDAPIEVLELPDGSTASLPTADEGETVTYTLAYDLLADPVTNGKITDVVQPGLSYVPGSAKGDSQFTFVGYDSATRTLTWTAANVSQDGSVSYQVTVDTGASELSQPIPNVAVIKSDQTAPDDGNADVYVPTIPEAATATPRITLPPTDTLSGPQDPGNPGFSLMLILLALAAFVLVIGFVTPVPASVRERSRR